MADVELTVDADVCEANAVCVGIAPELFALDDEDALQILEVRPQHDMLERARQAVDSCPKRALRLRQSPP
ncbi:ferredoxin [Mycobacterium branderi]|uniref:Ferredoxin n=1 Tax=Mycobacterium branderi TaxID=43348 RepID=A0A7I7WFJ4_9MYCO|nr:ferredoxin [Mycobacterium branderi]MCV7231731.1 ferredoxin [Mycobacterium branderi]ORA40301.1 ferredoxin [Mycobacterium branderi]BBZ15617.1 ferredoxin [Mycobacterium branderi]